MVTELNGSNIVKPTKTPKGLFHRPIFKKINYITIFPHCYFAIYVILVY